MSKRLFSLIKLNPNRTICSDFMTLGKNMVSDFGFRLSSKLTLTRCKPFLKKKVIDNVVSVYKNMFTYLRHTFSFPFDSWHQFFFAGKSDLFCLILHFVYVSHSPMNIQKKSMHDRQWHGLLKIKNHLTKIFNVAENNLITEFNKS